MLRMEKCVLQIWKTATIGKGGGKKKSANIGGPFDLKLVGALQLSTVKKVSCYTGCYGGPGTWTESAVL